MVDYLQVNRGLGSGECCGRRSKSKLEGRRQERMYEDGYLYVSSMVDESPFGLNTETNI